MASKIFLFGLIVYGMNGVNGVPTEIVTSRLLGNTIGTTSPILSPVRLVQATTSEKDKVQFDPHPQYNFGYSVADTITGDAKTRVESRDGNVVKGSYSVADPDGRIRTVTYIDDGVHGFQAKVTYDGAEGPVAIPFDADTAVAKAAVPSTTVLQSQPQAVHTVGHSSPVVTAIRGLSNTDHVLHSTSTAVRQGDQAVHAIHTSPVVTAVRAVPQQVHAVHTTPLIHNLNNLNTVTAVRQIPQAVHTLHTASPAAVAAVHSGANALHTIHTSPVVTAVRNVPQTAIHTTPILTTSNGAVTIAGRQVPSATVLHALHPAATTSTIPVVSRAIQHHDLNNVSLRSLLVDSGIDLSRFRLISPGNVVQN